MIGVVCGLKAKVKKRMNERGVDFEEVCILVNSDWLATGSLHMRKHFELR